MSLNSGRSLAKWPSGAGGPSCAADGTIIQGTGVLGSWWWTAARNCEWIWNGIYGTDYSRPSEARGGA